MQTPTSPLSSLADQPVDHLTARLYELRRRERDLLVEFLVYLAELDRRRAYLELGFSSLFAFLTDYLGYTRSAAFRRTTAARLLARFPVVAEHLADGRLNLTTLVELRDVLDEERLPEILARAAGRTEDQVKELVAALRPREAPADLLCRLPVPVANSNQVPVAPSPPARPAARFEPVSEELRVLRITVDRDFVADVEAARAALSHQLPGASLQAVLHHCVKATLDDCERQRRGTGRAHPESEPPTRRSRYVAAGVRDQIWRRDEGRCAFVGTTGHRCNSTHLHEVHHIDSFARGGASTVANLALRCAQHNRFHAEADFGVEHVARAIAAGQQSLW